MPFQKVQAEKLSLAAVRQIEQLILRGILRPGERLPAERELSDRMGISRPILRDALADLDARGLLAIRPNAGIFVAEVLGSAFSPALVALFASHEEAVFDYLAFRRDMEGLAAARTAEGRLHYDVGHAEDAVAANQKALALNSTLADAQPQNTGMLEVLAMVHEQLAMSLRESGRFEESLVHYDETIRFVTAAYELKTPGAAAPVGNYLLERAKALCRLGKYAEAIAACRSASDVDGQLDLACATVVIAHAQVASGSVSEAIVAIADFDVTRLSDPRDQIELAATWALLGRAAAEGRLESEGNGQDQSLTQEACSLRAIALIDAALSQGFRNMAVLHSNPSLDDLRARPDYQSLLARYSSDPD